MGEHSIEDILERFKTKKHGRWCGWIKCIDGVDRYNGRFVIKDAVYGGHFTEDRLKTLGIEIPSKR